MKLFRIVVLLLFSFAFGDEQTLSDSYGASAIEGALFDDYNQNGLQETGELGLPGWIVYADLNYNNSFDSNEPNAITDSLGYYELAGLEGGAYLISCVTKAGWRQTLMQETQFPLSPSYTTKKAEPTYQTASISSPIYTQGFVSDIIQPNMSQVTDVIRKDDFDLDSQYSQYTGNGYSAVIIDTGIDVDHSFFGPDADNDGVADRIAYQYDFAEDDSDATDYDGHGSNVASIVASSDQTYRGIAPDANIIALKVFTDTGYGDFAYVEEALQWVIQNATVYNIASVNISLGDSSNNSSYVSYYGVSDELEALKELNIITVCASGNAFYSKNSQQGCSYPASDANTLSVGATYDANLGSEYYNSGARAYTTDVDRICPFSQREQNIASFMAPGAVVTGANQSGGLLSMSGTSQASPVVSGAILIAQQISNDLRGESFSLSQIRSLLSATGKVLNDGDDENDNVVNTLLDFKGLDFYAMANAISVIADPYSYYVTISGSERISNIDFSFWHLTADLNGDDSVDEDDIRIFASCWLDVPEGGCETADINLDSEVNILDFHTIFLQWML